MLFKFGGILFNITSNKIFLSFNKYTYHWKTNCTIFFAILYAFTTTLMSIACTRMNGVIEYTRTTEYRFFCNHTVDQAFVRDVIQNLSR